MILILESLSLFIRIDIYIYIVVLVDNKYKKYK